MSQIDIFHTREKKVIDLIEIRFSKESLAYGKFIGTLNTLYKDITARINEYVYKLEIFDEESYKEKIEYYEKEGNKEAIYNHRQIAFEYEDYARKSLEMIQDANLKLDKLLLELSDLNEKNKNDSLKEMEELINQTKLYKGK